MNARILAQVPGGKLVSAPQEHLHSKLDLTTDSTTQSTQLH